MLNSTGSKFNVADRSAKLIYKDLIKLVKKTMPVSKQIIVLPLLRKEFDKNSNLTNPKDIERLKESAGKAIADTYVYFVKEDYVSRKEEYKHKKEEDSDDESDYDPKKYKGTSRNRAI